MGTPAYNLVIVKGAREDLNIFEKLAFKAESEAFSFNQILPLPSYLAHEAEMSDEVQAYRHIVYGSKWVGAFSVLIEKTNSYLKYYFNSKYTKAQLDYIAVKFGNLNFTQVFVEISEGQCGVIKYEKGKRIFDISIKNENIDWQIASNIHTFLYIEELHHKINLLYQTKPKEFKELTNAFSSQNQTFNSFFSKSKYLTENEKFYDSLYLMERELETRELDYARNGTAYTFRTNDLDDQLKFIEQNYLPSAKKNQYINNISNRAKNGQA